MGLILLLVFIATPIAEIAVFIEAGNRFGLWPTVLAIIGTALLGAALLRWQGMATLARVSQSLQRNELPVAELFTGLCLVAAGALLLTPGFLTDSVGFLLFVPPFRRLLGHFLRRFLESRGTLWNKNAPRGANQSPFSRQDPFPGDGPIIDGEFHEKDPTRNTLTPDAGLPPPDDASPKSSPENSPWRGSSSSNNRNNREKP